MYAPTHDNYPDTLKDAKLTKTTDHRRPRQTPIHPLHNLQRNLPPTSPALRHLRNNNLHAPRALRLSLPPPRILRALRRPNDLSRTNSAPDPEHLQAIRERPRVRRDRLARSAERTRSALYAGDYRSAGDIAAEPPTHLDGYEYAHA